MKKIFLMLLIISACKKESPEPSYEAKTRDIDYQVIASQREVLNIWNATNTGTLLPDGSKEYVNLKDYFCFDGRQKIKKGDKYYIKVKYNGPYKPEYYYRVVIYCDGNILRDVTTAFHKLNSDSTVTFLQDTFAKYQVIELSGIVPN